MKVNDWVLIATHPLSSTTKKVEAKFKPKFEGRHRILDKNNNVVVWKAGKRLMVNFDQTKRWKRSGVPTSQRGRHNREDQFDPEKAEEGRTTPTSKSEQNQATGMPDEEVINNGRTRKGKERVREGHYP
ncbi:hypothetical protein TNCV_4909501 [Trichonephila clavipes]|uniref:Uncharacterized protein n=1 Tax=Trichonephila clavipes TaxID=2585209 RepID=A0A8X6S0G4_TRICX|nr:hypothetical protein TNCV_4909501 [Trichonephila clavipes]